MQEQLSRRGDAEKNQENFTVILNEAEASYVYIFKLDLTVDVKSRMTAVEP